MTMMMTMTTCTLFTGDVTRDGGRLGGLEGGREPADGVPARFQTLYFKIKIFSIIRNAAITPTYFLSLAIGERLEIEKCERTPQGFPIWRTTILIGFCIEKR